jgi:hypothetical protein
MGYVYRGTLRDVGPAPVRLSSTPGPKPKVIVFDPSKCGTYPGYQQHARTGTPKCQPCKDANAAYSRDYAARVKTGQVRELHRGFRDDACGTYAGYCRHLRHKVPACGPCLDASRDHTAKHRAKQVAA